MSYRITKQSVDNPKFIVNDCVQGQPMDYECKTLLGALFLYTKHYISKKKYKTMNVSLKESYKDGE